MDRWSSGADLVSVKAKHRLREKEFCAKRGRVGIVPERIINPAAARCNWDRGGRMRAINRQFSTMDANYLVSYFKPPQLTPFDDQSAFPYSRRPLHTAS